MKKIIDFIKHRNLRRRTNDGKTLQELYDKVRELVKKYNFSKDSDEDIADFIIKSFADDGFISTYNELGNYEWQKFMTYIIKEEIAERSNSKWWKR